MTEHTIPSIHMQMGDRIIVEPAEGEDFEATVRFCMGWGLVHNVMMWKLSRDDGTEFTYGIHIDAPVRVVMK